MVNELIVKIIAERIANKGENPLRKRPFILEDITNLEYKKAVEDFILVNSKTLDSNVVDDIEHEKSTGISKTTQVDK